jgi:Zn-dependent M32 family carboxypeptidase
MTTIENNKLIAEFMGKEYKNNAIVVSTNYITGQNPSGKVWQEPKYHNDWNWLMEVVEKIESLSNEQKVINWSRQNKCIFDFKLTESKKEAVYNASVEFIKWLNENKQNNL